nr:PREDICTED: probable 28S ribosomal protein S25, mitochondrial [Bemisia tabaci]
MPFMHGHVPIRRTLKYLNAGQIILKERIKIFSLNFSSRGDHHKGAREFAFWHLQQLQHKNPDVHVVEFKDLTPSPFIRCFTDNGDSVIIDLEGRSKESIHDHVMKVLGKSEDLLEKEAKAREKKENPANFGYMCEKNCICEFFGQVPCPGVVPLPLYMKGKTIKKLLEGDD